MSHRVSRSMIAVVLLSTCLISLVTTPRAATRASGDPSFTAATLLADKGMHGGWLMKEPPDFPPVECNLLRDENRFRAVVVELPLLFPAEGFAFQRIQATYRLNRRLPDGKLVSLTTNPVAGEVSATSHLEGSTTFEGDLGSTYVVT